MSHRHCLVAVFLAGLLVVPMAFCQDVPRHLDPGTLEGEDPLPMEVALLYQELFESIGAENYSEAFNVLARGMEVEALPETKLILDRYNELLLLEISSLEDSEAYLSDAAEFLRFVQIEEADDALVRSLGELGSANHTLGLLFEAAIQLGNRLGTPRDELVDDLQAAAGVLEEYYRMYGELDEEGNVAEGLIESRLLNKTVLELTSVSDGVRVGELVFIRGKLSTVDGVGLSREVGFYIDGVYIGKAVSDADGGFYVGFPAPEVYGGFVDVWAEYWPSGGDRDRFTPTRSEVRSVRVDYLVPEIVLDVPEAVYPGRGFNVSGVVSYDGVPVEGVGVWFSDGGVLRARSGEGGVFSFTRVVPGNATGYGFRVGVESDGVYGPGRVEVDVPVRWYPVSLVLRPSSVNIGGGFFTVRGSVSSSVPVDGAEYLVVYQGSQGSYQVVTGGDFVIRVPLGLMIASSSYGYRVQARSSVPWLGDAVVSARFFAVNPVIPLFIAVACSYLYVNRGLVLGYFVVRDDDEVVRVSVPDPGVYPSGLGLFVLRAREVLGVSVSPSMTLREYLASLTGRVGVGLVDAVRGLILGYERGLYGPGGVDDGLDGVGEELAGRLSDEG